MLVCCCYVVLCHQLLPWNLPESISPGPVEALWWQAARVPKGALPFILFVRLCTCVLSTSHPPCSAGMMPVLTLVQAARQDTSVGFLGGVHTAAAHLGRHDCFVLLYPSNGALRRCLLLWSPANGAVVVCATQRGSEKSTSSCMQPAQLNPMSPVFKLSGVLPFKVVGFVIAATVCLQLSCCVSPVPFPPSHGLH